MDCTQQHINKFREERIAKEKARIEKLRQLNLQKYSKNDMSTSYSSSSVSLPVKSKLSTSCTSRSKSNTQSSLEGKANIAHNRKSFAIPKQAECQKIPAANNPKNNIVKKNPNYINLNKTKVSKELSKTNVNYKTSKPVKESIVNNVKTVTKINTLLKPAQNNASKSSTFSSKINKLQTADEKKSVQPNVPKHTKPNSESVFERLYKPKVVQRQTIDNALRLKTDPNYLKKVIKDSRLIMNKRHTVCDNKPALPVRRSISAVHFKRISKSELQNCMHKWASVGEKINKEHLKDVNEDHHVKQERVISAVKSERKKVKFQTPMHLNFNTPKPEELQSRLQKWLQKRGKSLDSYHHLQCFGLHHVSKDIKKFELFDGDDENKENIAVENDGDNESYLDNMNNRNSHTQEEIKGFPVDKWRRASAASDSVDFNETCETTIDSEVQQVDELLLGALNDLTDLLKEGFDWEQCARWLRAIRDRYPLAPDKAAYWECRAALEECRGDLPASVQCWEQAIVAGTEQSVVEANLDHLLDKFMQLKISPSGTTKRHVDPKLVDVKNVFKSTIIRFAVQKAKLRQPSETLKYTVTPVRRSSRISIYKPTHTPLRVCTTIKQATEMGAEFKPNKALVNTP